MATHFVRSGWYALQYNSGNERITAYKEFTTADELRATIDRWSGKGYMVRTVTFIPDPTSVRVNGKPLVDPEK